MGAVGAVGYAATFSVIDLRVCWDWTKDATRRMRIPAGEEDNTHELRRLSKRNAIRFSYQGGPGDARRPNQARTWRVAHHCGGRMPCKVLAARRQHGQDA